MTTTLPDPDSNHDLLYRDLYMKSFEYMPSYWKNRHLDQTDPDLPSASQSNKQDIHIIDYGKSLTKAGNIQHLCPILVWPSETLKLKKSFREFFDNDQVYSFDHVLSAEQDSRLAKRGHQDPSRVPYAKPPSSAFLSHIPQNQVKQYGFYHNQNYGVVVGKNVFENGFKALDLRNFERLNDGIFTKLQVRRGDRLAYTEPIGVVPKFRSTCAELFFECYELEAVMPCVDSIGASYGLLTGIGRPDAVVISVGESQTTVLVFIGSNLRVDLVRTIPIGMSHIKHQFGRLLHNKYPVVNERISPKVFENLFAAEAFVSTDYIRQTRFLKQVEYDNVFEGRRPEGLRPALALKYYHSEEEHKYILEQDRLKRLRRQEQSRKASQIMKVKREQKRASFKLRLQRLKRILEQVRAGDQAAVLEMEEEQIHSLKDLEAKVFNMRMKLGQVGEDELHQKRYGLLARRDEDLTPDQRRVKKYQKMQKMNALRRQQKKRQQQQEQRRVEAIKAQFPQRYLDDLLGKRRAVKSKLKRIKVELTQDVQGGPQVQKAEGLQDPAEGRQLPGRQLHAR